MLGGVRTEWQSPAFQVGVDSPAAFIGHYFNLHADAGGNAEVCKCLQIILLQTMMCHPAPHVPNHLQDCRFRHLQVAIASLNCGSLVQLSCMHIMALQNILSEHHYLHLTANMIDATASNGVVIIATVMHCNRCILRWPLPAFILLSLLCV